MQFTTLFTIISTISTIALASQCDVGEVQCCNTVTGADDPKAQEAINQVGAVIEDLTVAVGLECNPITVIGAGFGSCNIEPVCCEDNSFGSLLSIGCIPINAA